MRAGLIVEVHSYHAPSPKDQTDAAEVPSRQEAARVVHDQAALFRVATLVAEGAPEAGVFATVNEEVARIVGADAAFLLRFEANDAMTLLAAWSAADVEHAIGLSQPIGDRLRLVCDDGSPVCSRPAICARAPRWPS